MKDNRKRLEELQLKIRTWQSDPNGVATDEYREAVQEFLKLKRQQTRRGKK
jgi:hypothetical protein